MKLIVALDNKNGIGKNNKLAWNHSCDLKYFSKLTKGNGNNCIIMGRFEAFALTIKKEKEALCGRADLFCTDGGLWMASTVQSSLNQSQTQQCNVSDIHNATMIHITYRIGYKP